MFKIGDKLKHISHPELRYEIRGSHMDNSLYDDADDGDLYWHVWSYYSNKTHLIKDADLRSHMTDGTAFGVNLVFDNGITIQPSNNPLRRHRLCTK